MLSIKSPQEISLELAERVRKCRLQHAWSREELAKRAGITVASLKRFELTGQIALVRLLQLSFTLSKLKDFDKVLLLDSPKTLDDIKKSQRERKRGKKKSTP